jgi:hypothetical protein
LSEACNAHTFGVGRSLVFTLVFTGSPCPLFLRGTIVKNYTPCKMEHQHVLRFLYVRGLTAIFLVAILGGKDQKTDNRVIYFTGIGPKRKSAS